MLHVPADVLAKLANRREDSIRYLVANHPNTPAATLRILAFDHYDLVQCAVAGNPSTPIDVLPEMAQQEQLTTSVGCHYTVSNQIAMRKDAPAATLAIIARQPVLPIRKQVAINPNTPATALAWLIENETDRDVLVAAAGNPNVTPELFE